MLKKIGDTTSVDLLLWRIDFMLKCWRKLYMFEVDLSSKDFDLESILQSLVGMSSSVDSPTAELDPELILRFLIRMLRELCDLDLGWFYGLILKCCRKLKLDRSHDFKWTCRGKWYPIENVDFEVWKFFSLLCIENFWKLY